MAGESVTLIPFSETFINLSDIDRLRALDRLILATRTRLVLSKASKLSLSQRMEIAQQETLLTTYLQLGSLERRPAEQLIQVVFSLAKGQPRPAFPPELMRPGETLSFERALEMAPPGCKEVLERVVQFAMEAVSKDWVEPNFIVEYLTDTLLNYKTTRKVFNRFSEFLKSTIASVSV